MAKKNEKQETAVAKVETNTALVAPNEVDAMFGGAGYQIPIDAPLPAIKILRETPQYELPDGETVKEVVGHIIYWHNASQYYATAFGEGEQGPPNCASSDGITPDGGTSPFTAPCRDCPMNVYGSAGEDGKGKACQNTIRLYILADGEIIPCVLRAPPSSLGSKESLLKWLTNAANVAFKAGFGTKFQPIKVKFALHKKEFSSGFSASVIDISTVRVLDKTSLEDMTTLKNLATLYDRFMKSYKARIREDVSTEKSTAETATSDDDGLPKDDKIPF